MPRKKVNREPIIYNAGLIWLVSYVLGDLAVNFKLWILFWVCEPIAAVAIAIVLYQSYKKIKEDE